MNSTKITLRDPVACLREWLIDSPECSDGFIRGDSSHDHDCHEFDHMRDVEAILDELERLQKFAREFGEVAADLGVDAVNDSVDKFHPVDIAILGGDPSL